MYIYILEPRTRALRARALKYLQDLLSSRHGGLLMPAPTHHLKVLTNPAPPIHWTALAARMNE